MSSVGKVLVNVLNVLFYGVIQNGVQYSLLELPRQRAGREFKRCVGVDRLVAMPLDADTMVPMQNRLQRRLEELGQFLRRERLARRFARICFFGCWTIILWRHIRRRNLRW